MSKTLLLIPALAFTISLFAQQSGFGVYVVNLKDKGSNKNILLNPSMFLSEMAVERRMKQQIAFDVSDLPVNEHFIDEITRSGAQVLTRSRWLNLVVIEADADIVKSIQNLPFISKIQPLGSETKQTSASFSEKEFFNEGKVIPLINTYTKKAATDSYNYGKALNQISQLKGQTLHNMGLLGQGMTIAVIDAGFNSVDLMTCFDSLRANKQIKGTRDFAVPGNNVYATSMHSHGTMVLSCMAANISGQMVGTAPKANYWLLRSEVAATESIIEEYYWVSAAEFADSVGADLINSSLGYTTFDNAATNHSYADMDGNTTIITRGADKAAQKGILVVNSAGNSGGGGWWYIGAPADGDSVFTIGAVNAFGVRSSFSSVGYSYDRRIKPTIVAQGSEATVFAPGTSANPTGILSTASGTSFSSPIICGITACLWQAYPHLNNMQIIESIKATASQVSHPDSLLGWGIPDYSQALQYLSVHTDPIQKVLQIYPNPITDHFTINMPFSLQGKFCVKIINLQGKVVYSKQIQEDSTASILITDIANLRSGIYFLSLSNDKSSYSTKIIKM